MARILLVEDESLIAVALQLSLEHAGHHVEAAANGRRALQKLDAGFVPDILITDFMMPVMDGPALIRAVHERPGLANLPVLLMSAVPQSHIQDGVVYDDFLAKPFHDTALLRKLNGLLDGSRPIRPR